MSDQPNYLRQALSDPVWRLNNLYQILDKSGRQIPFRPTPPQAALINAIYKQGERRHIILKARQMGFSTLIDLMLYDAAYWNANTACAIVDQTQAAASAKLKTKIAFAHENLPEALRQAPTTNNGSEIAFQHGSSIIAGKHVRGTTLQWLHISEWGPIAYEDPSRSEEIKTGALPAAELGRIIVETTYKGGKGGHLYELIRRSQETPEDQRTEKDFRFWFFPWYLDKSYTLKGPAHAIKPEVNEYLDAKERELGRTFDKGQRLWYTKTREDQGIFMYREYPTTPDEAFQAPVEGSIYGDIISKIRAAGNITPHLPHDPAYPAYTAWDIGWNDSTSIWLFQLVGHSVHFLWHLRERRLTAAEAYARLAATGIPIAANFLPHDAQNTAAATGLSYATALQNAGASNIRHLPQSRDTWAGINAARDILARARFHATACALGIESLEAYHTKETGSAALMRDPIHDWSSHDADAMRYAATAITTGQIANDTARRLNRRLAIDPSLELPNYYARLEPHHRPTALSGLPDMRRPKI